jgi:hypothetical protein
MSSIAQCVNYDSDSNSFNMSIFSSPLVVYQDCRIPTSDLEYVEEISPPILFGTAEHVQPINLWPLKVQDDEKSDKDKSPVLSVPFSNAHPAQVHIKIEEFEETHNA